MSHVSALNFPHHHAGWCCSVDEDMSMLIDSIVIWNLLRVLLTRRLSRMVVLASGNRGFDRSYNQLAQGLHASMRWALRNSVQLNSSFKVVFLSAAWSVWIINSFNHLGIQACNLLWLANVSGEQSCTLGQPLISANLHQQNRWPDGDKISIRLHYSSLV